MTGSKAQLYNGITLLFTFAGCRLVYGTMQSAFVYYDMWRAIRHSPDAGYAAAAKSNSTLSDPDNNVMAFAKDAAPIPLWLAALYVASNVTLNTLNWHWFFKMIAAVRKRFEPAKEEKEKLLVDGKPAAAAVTGTERAFPTARKRRSTLEDLTPDSEELREGTIQ